MPELPEVETVCRGLAKRIRGRTIKSLSLHRTGLRFAFPPGVAHAVAGQKVTSVDRFAKYILLRLKDGGTLLIHLGMSGRMLYADKKNHDRGKHDHVVFEFDRGPLLIFNDARRFGVLDYLPPGAKDRHKLLNTLGLDPFDEALTPKWLSDKIAHRKTTMKAILMDQHLIAGLGNIYVCEALFEAKIWPARQGDSLDAADCRRLVPAIRKVLTAAIEAGGSSLRDYVQPDGELGFFQDKFKVYGRTGKPCPRCRHPVERFAQNGRSTFACPNCQK